MIMKKTNNFKFYLIKYRSALIILIALILPLTIPSLTDAQIINPVVGEKLGGNVDEAVAGETFINYAVLLWRSTISLGALAVLMYFFIGAFKWITSHGESGKVEEAKNIMTNAVIGLILLVSSFTIIGFISNILFGDKFKILELTFPGTGVE